MALGEKGRATSAAAAFGSAGAASGGEAGRVDFFGADARRGAEAFFRELFLRAGGAFRAGFRAGFFRPRVLAALRGRATLRRVPAFLRRATFFFRVAPLLRATFFLRVALFFRAVFFLRAVFFFRAVFFRRAVFFLRAVDFFRAGAFFRREATFFFRAGLRRAVFFLDVRFRADFFFAVFFFTFLRPVFRAALRRATFFFRAPFLRAAIPNPPPRPPWAP